MLRKYSEPGFLFLSHRPWIFILRAKHLGVTPSDSNHPITRLLISITLSQFPTSLWVSAISLANCVCRVSGRTEKSVSASSSLSFLYCVWNKRWHFRVWETGGGQMFHLRAGQSMAAPRSGSPTCAWRGASLPFQGVGGRAPRSPPSSRPPCTSPASQKPNVVTGA